jgi:hypothetical protein
VAIILLARGEFAVVWEVSKKWQMSVDARSGRPSTEVCVEVKEPIDQRIRYNKSIYTDETAYQLSNTLDPSFEGSNPVEGNEFLRTIKNRSTSFGDEVKPLAPCREILGQVKEPFSEI